MGKRINHRYKGKTHTRAHIIFSPVIIKCMCIEVYTCMYIRTYLRRYMHRYLRKCVYVFLYVCMYVCMHLIMNERTGSGILIKKIFCNFVHVMFVCIDV